MLATADPTADSTADPTAEATADLLDRAAAGRPDAWAELTRRYTPLLRARAPRYRLQEADALDAIQTTWLRLAEHLHAIRSPDHLAGWLATVVGRECLRITTQRARTIVSDEVGLAEPNAGAGPEQAVVDAHLRRALRAALAELSPARRALVGALFADDRKPYAEIAREAGMPIGSLGPTRARALAELRRILERRGLTV
jgi:RNA polymerase sigma factor (sigma-70 family)